MALVLVAVMIPAAGATGQILTRDVLLYVDVPPSAWAESYLAEETARALTRDYRVRVNTVLPDDTSFAPFPERRYDLDSLGAWGREVGGRYLIVVLVDEQSIQRKKTLQVPLVFHRWETIASVSGELRIIDLGSSKLLHADLFEEEIPLKRAFQLTPDDDQFDPDLHVPAADKIRAFRALDRQTAGALARTVNDRALRR
jgi:hypothetical protein